MKKSFRANMYLPFYTIRKGLGTLRNTPFVLICFVLLVVSNLKLIAQTPKETFSITEEMSFETHVMNGADFPNTISTYNGEIYYAYIDRDLKGKVAKKDIDGNVTEHIIIDAVVYNEHHTEVSMMVDADGYIHYIGNIHGQPMKYWRSDNPEDITSFTAYNNDVEHGGISGNAVTYSRFVKNRAGKIFLCYRAGTIDENLNGGRSPGWKGGAIARYDTNTKQWTSLGSLNYEFTNANGAKVFGDGIDEWNQNLVVWDSSGIATASGRAYQAYKLRVVFDKNDRMHLAWNVGRNKVNANPSAVASEMTHIMYAYSDDEGDTWHKADGTRLHLPMTSENADIVFADESAEMGNFLELILDDQGNPVIFQPSFERDGEGNTRFVVYVFNWNGTEWEKVNYSDSEGWIRRLGFPVDWPGMACTDFYGVITLFDTDHLREIKRSWDGGETWKTYVLDEGFEYLSRVVSVDYDLLYATGDIRFQAQSDPGNGTPYTVKVLTIDFESNDDLEPPKPDEKEEQNPLTQTITFETIEDRPFGTFSLKATSTSTLPVTYSVIEGDAEIVNGSRFVPFGLGTFTIEARQEGNNMFLPATPIQQTFSINEKGTQIITFNFVPNKEFGDPSFEIKAESDAGLPIIFEIISGLASIDGKIVTIEGVGEVIIEATALGNENYFDATAQTSFNISKASQTVAFAEVEDINPQKEEDLTVILNAVASSGLPVEFEVLSGPASVNNNILTLDGTKGSILIRALQKGDNNYEPAPIVGQRIEVLSSLIIANLDDYKTQEVAIYPNPTNQFINIDLTYTINASISIYDNVGRKVYQKRQTKPTEVINVSSFEQGLYYINIVLEDTTIHHRIVKTN